MSELVKAGDWVYSYSIGIWQVSRMLSGFNEIRFSLDEPKRKSRRTLVFSYRLLNSSWKRSFSVEIAELNFVNLLTAEETSRVEEMLESDPKLRKSFGKYQATHTIPDLIVNVALGGLPSGDRDHLREACDAQLGTSPENGKTMDEVLVALTASGYYEYIGKLPTSATVQLVSKGHEVRDGEFVLRYGRVLDF